MKLLLKRLQEDWPSWLALSFFALLPFSRLAEIPLSIFAFSVGSPQNRHIFLVTTLRHCSEHKVAS